MANTLIALPATRTRRQTQRSYSGIFTGGAYALGGELVDPTNATDPNFLAEPIAGFFDIADHQARIYKAEVTKAPAGYGAEILLNPAATGWNNAYFVKLFSAPGVELAAAAYPAAILADRFHFSITGPSGKF